MILLDTNVLSEPMRPAPNRRVLAWLDGLDPAGLHTTAISLAELRHGALRLEAGRRRSALLAAVDAVETVVCAGRVLAFEAADASVYGEIRALRERAGQPIGATDAMIAAIALRRRLPLATRNTRDFALLGIDLVDPFG